MVDQNKTIITVVHDDTDAVKYCIKYLRMNLAYVDPLVSFESCCVWDFHDHIFHTKRKLLVLLSKKTLPFCKTIYALALKQKLLFLARQTRLCIVLETTSTFIEARFEEVIGKNNIACVKDLFDMFSWLPKIAIFLFPPAKSMKYLQKCAIPSIDDDATLTMYRMGFIDGLKDLGVSILENLNQISSSRCGFLLRNKKEPLAKNVMEVVDASVQRGSQILHYIVHYEAKPRTHKKRSTYGKKCQTLFVIHVLYIIGLIDIVAVRGRVCRRRVTKIEGIKENVAIADIVVCLVLSLFNPGLILCFFTPLPYIAFMLGKTTGWRQVWVLSLVFWLIISLLCIYGISFYFLAKSDVLPYVAPGLCLLVLCSSLCTYIIGRLILRMINKLWELDLL